MILSLSLPSSPFISLYPPSTFQPFCFQLSLPSHPTATHFSRSVTATPESHCFQTALCAQTAAMDQCWPRRVLSLSLSLSSSLLFLSLSPLSSLSLTLSPSLHILTPLSPSPFLVLFPSHERIVPRFPAFFPLHTPFQHSLHTRTHTPSSCPPFAHTFSLGLSISASLADTHTLLLSCSRQSLRLPLSTSRHNANSSGSDASRSRRTYPIVLARSSTDTSIYSSLFFFCFCFIAASVWSLAFAVRPPLSSSHPTSDAPSLHFHFLLFPLHATFRTFSCLVVSFHLQQRQRNEGLAAENKLRHGCDSPITKTRVAFCSSPPHRRCWEARTTALSSSTTVSARALSAIWRQRSLRRLRSTPSSYNET